jgi:hypothetical protein
MARAVDDPTLQDEILAAIHSAASGIAEGQGPHS